VSELVPALQRLFGFSEFRPGQEQVVRAAVAGRDTLALMPTGSGKSLTYQLAAMLRPTPTLVLSPLIALMKDQLDKLPPEVAAQSTLINSSLDAAEAARRLRDASAGRYRLLYVAPERLRQRSFLEAIAGIHVGLVVIDEAHCVSMWGHDFRPDYLFIRRALEGLSRPAILGMTATATPATEREIAAALGREPEVVRTSVVRPNLRYDVHVVDGEESRLRVLVARLRQLCGGSAIVYARSRRSCESLARTLRVHDLPALHYHAGLDPDERTEAQEAFLEGRVQTVVATTAFGMGIDKPDVRLVALYNYPESLESYVQMVGRAGRDGEPADTLLLASRADAVQLRRFARSDIPTVTDLRAVYGRLRGRAEVLPEELVQGPDGPDPRVLVGMLEQVGLARRGFDAGRCLQVEVGEPPPDAAARIDALLARYEREALARADRLVRFAELRACRHRQVAEHFGETLEVDCGRCDVCAPREAAAGEAREADVAAPLPDDVAGAIYRAVQELRWPLGRTGLTAMLRGSMTAPRSAQRSPHFGVLAAATQADVKRWLQLVELAGAIEPFESEDGFRLLRAVPRADVPRIGAAAAATPDEGLFERLRAWRLERARSDEVPAYVVLHDATLRELAATKPTSPRDLAGVKGFGPAKLERYADDVLAVISAADA
jgi:ATP-dependent DNA helicase RecQ